MENTLVTGGNVTIPPAVTAPAARSARTGGIVQIIIGIIIAIVGLALVARAAAVVTGVTTTATTYTSGTHDLTPGFIGAGILLLGSLIFTIGIVHSSNERFRDAPIAVIGYALVYCPPFLIVAMLVGSMFGDNSLQTWGEQHGIESLSLPDTRGEDSLTFTRDGTDGKPMQLKYQSNDGGTYTLTILDPDTTAASS